MGTVDLEVNTSPKPKNDEYYDYDYYAYDPISEESSILTEPCVRNDGFFNLPIDGAWYGSCIEEPTVCDEENLVIGGYCECRSIGQPGCRRKRSTDDLSDTCNTLRWMYDAAEYIEFETSEDKFGQVNLTIWVHPRAFGIYYLSLIHI